MKVKQYDWAFSVVLQPLGWRCVECAIHHERQVRKASRCGSK